MTEQASRFLKPCPRRLAWLIELVNLIPPGVELPDLRADLRQFSEEVGERQGSEAGWNEWITKAGSALLQKHPILGILRERARANGIAEPNLLLGEEIYEAAGTCTFIRDAREKLERIIYSCKNPSAAELGMMGIGRPYSPITTEAMIYVGDDGIVRVGLDRFSRAIDEVDARRIRECLVCKRIFWAGRIDSHCCNSRCADIRRKRLYRARGAAKKLADKQRRISNDEYRKQVVASQGQRGAPVTARKKDTNRK